MHETPYAELHVTSNFSFLRGGSHPEELIARAHELGYRAIAITDHNSLAGIVRAHLAAKHAGIRLLVGCRLEIAWNACVLPLLVYPQERESYARLCRLLTVGKRRVAKGQVEKGQCFLTLEDFQAHAEGLVCILPRPVLRDRYLNADAQDFHAFAKKLAAALDRDNALSLTLTRTYATQQFSHEDIVLQIAAALKLPLVVTGDILYHAPERRPLQDVLTCIRRRTTVNDAGFDLSQNAERYLKPPREIYRLFRDQPQALRRSLEIAERLKNFSLDSLRYEYPDEICPEGASAQEYLRTITYRGLHERYPGGPPPKIQQLIDDELMLIRELAYEKYFLTCYDIVTFARARGILCQGRGAAANSAVCFALGITSVDPARIDLLFARFISKERNEPPDIDIDFEHERREEVIQYIYQKYGRHRAGLTCEVVTYRYRSAIRDVGKALGLSLEAVDKLAKSIHRWTGAKVTASDLAEIGLRADSTVVQNAFTLAQELLGFPRHLSQHVGGFIISQRALSETVPILNAAMDNRTIIEWDKDDIEALGMLKIDVLALGMLSAVRKALELINRRLLAEERASARSLVPYPLQFHTIPAEDPAVYDMICESDTVGVFQIESRAQMSMLPRLKPRCFYDLVIEVAIVRPGPIQGNMVHPYLKRRSGSEQVRFPDERVAHILGKTLGVPLFQEQAMRLAIVLANFTPGEAEQLRRAMAAWKRDKGVIATFKKRIVAGMLKNGYSQEFAETCMNQIKGFSEYGFPESHAASFALIVYVSAWIKRHYPAEFATALLNSQPMGFYAPAQLIRDAEQHGIKVLPIDVNRSTWDHHIESIDAIRLGLRLVKGLAQEQAHIIVTAVQSYGAFVSPHELWRMTRPHGLIKKSLELLAHADAFQSMNLNARQALWEITALPQEIDSLPLTEPNNTPRPPFHTTKQQQMFTDYRTTGLSLKGHPIGFIRQSLNKRNVATAQALKSAKAHTLVSTAGIAIVKQRPSTAKGVVFITLEDETGHTNLIIRPHTFEKYRTIILSSSCILAHGSLEKVGHLPYVNTSQLEALDPLIQNLKNSPLPSKSYSY